MIALLNKIIEILKSPFSKRASRYSVLLKARILGKNEDVLAEIHDISESGCFAHLNCNFEMGALVGIDFSYANMQVHAVGIVVRKAKNPAGCGFMFVASTKSEKTHIKNLIRRLDADSNKLNKKRAA